MTIVIAQIRNDEILILADTKIHDPNETGPNTIPGRLKIVTLGHQFTVAFAGAADPAQIAIQNVAKLVSVKAFEAAIETLKDWSKQYDIDFISASHLPRAQLLLIRRGGALDIRDICSIGDAGPFEELVEAARVSNEDGPLKRSNLRTRFIDRLMTNRGLGDHIGGFPTAVEATSEGHRYLSCSGFYTFKFPALKWGEETHQSIEEVYSGEGHLEMAMMAPSRSDIPVMGVCLVQARTGYLYSPLCRQPARLIKLIDQQKWAGHETAMYAVLRQAMDEEVENLCQAFPSQFMDACKADTSR